MLWYLIQDDMQQVEHQWNTQNIPALVKHGIIKEGLRFEFEKTEDIGQLWDFVSGLLPYYDFDPEWLKQKFGTEVTTAKNQQTQAQTQQNGLSFFPQASESEALQNNCCGEAHTQTIRLAAINQDSLITRYYDAQGKKQFDAELFSYTAQELSKAFLEGWNSEQKTLSIGFEYGTDDPATLTAYEMNLFRFAGVKTLAESQALNEAFRKSTSFSDFQQRASLITKVHNTEWLRTEYQTAMAVGETSATYNRLIQQQQLFPYWEYKTVEDSKVRVEHQLLHGLILPVNDPIWKKIYPPNGWNCRCFIIPRTSNELGDQNIQDNIQAAEAFTKSDEFKKATKSGWGVNRAEAKQVFTTNQQYITNNLEADKMLSKLGPADYAIKEVQNKPTLDTSKKQRIGAFILENKLVDYLNRKLKIAAGINHQEGLVPHIPDVLTTPDEVWFQASEKGNPFNQYLYLKRYKDQVLAIEAELKKTGLFINSISKLIDEEKKRWGLLIK